MSARDWSVRLRRRAGAAAADNFFRGASALGRLHPRARFERHGVECLRDIPYGSPGEAHRRLDVYRPIRGAGPLPVVLYVHGGGFRILSKQTHWLMGLAFARQGYLVLNIDYRLAPAHPFPAGLQDVAAAYEWSLEHAADYGADPGRLAFAGESAGANLCVALALMTCYPRPEPWAQEVFARGRVPGAVVPACGIYEVSNPERLADRVSSAFVMDRVREISRSYLGAAAGGAGGRPGALDLADPVVWLERGEAPARPLPPFYAPVGARDPLVGDSERLGEAITALGGRCEVAVYPGQVHAFHAFVFLREARRCWREMIGFLDRQLGPADAAGADRDRRRGESW